MYIDGTHVLVPRYRGRHILSFLSTTDQFGFFYLST
jgi:hypothetical protein